MFILLNKKLRNANETTILVMTGNISYIAPNSAGGSTVTTSSGILDVEETMEEIQLKLTESLI